MLTKLVRIGRDAELRYIPSGTAVASIPCVYDIGFGDKKRPQWIEISVWGKQAEALTQYLIKGKQVVIYADDIELEEYQKGNGEKGFKLKGRAVNIDLTSGGQQAAAQKPAQQQAPTQGGFQQQAPNPQGGGGFQQQQPAQPAYQQPKVNPQEPSIDFDDDIPF